MEKEEASERPTKLWIMAAALGLLIMFSAVQAVELAGLREKIDTGLSGLSAVPSGESVKTTTTSTNLQENLQNLPSMVGGC